MVDFHFRLCFQCWHESGLAHLCEGYSPAENSQGPIVVPAGRQFFVRMNGQRWPPGVALEGLCFAAQGGGAGRHGQLPLRASG